MKQSAFISSWSLVETSLIHLVDSTMAVSTRGASRILVDSIAIDLQLKQVEFICCSLTIETKELECWSLAIVLQVQPEMKWNGWCVDEMSACLKSKTNVSSLIINQWHNMYMERACNSASWTNLVDHLWLSSLILVTCHVSPMNPFPHLSGSLEKSLQPYLSKQKGKRLPRSI